MPGVRRSGKRRGPMDLVRAVNRINAMMLTSGKSPLLVASTRVDDPAPAPAVVAEPAADPTAEPAADPAAFANPVADPSVAERQHRSMAEDEHAAAPPVQAAAVMPVLPANEEK
ncbi:hypothetical protein PAHAL_7G338200 [Panicum hallii]|jgi:hypothetical protein|uniref:Uncharacterized protein n=1 Tax=Panicum hallii TaxID=206008 RepID=A0A2S3IBR9_9POAL|nr:hypothetical protein PAHAL_7G338200 [Panicum hallii]